MNLPKYILDILETLNQAGYQAYVVGGCVRDALLHRQIHDYDICTSAKPEQVIELFEHTIPTGLKHGTVSIVSKELVEVTTFRKETNYKDHRHPEKVEYVNDIETDLSRRDFTINAMAYHPKTGIIDPFHGQEDLKHKIIRCVGDPNIRFNEDALRMIRAYRFQAKLGFTIDLQAQQAIQENTKYIQYVAIERIVPEILEILKYNPKIILELKDLLYPWIPEFKNSNHIPKQHKDDLSNLCDWLSFTKQPSKVCKTLKLSNTDRKQIIFYIEHKEDILKNTLNCIYTYRIQYKLSDEEMIRFIQLKEDPSFLDYYLQEKYRPMSIKDLKINGNDILEYTNLRGKEIQEAFNICLKLVFFEPHKNTKEYLIKELIMPKIIVADIDSTLVNDNRDMLESTQKTLDQCREQGILFGIASGRPLDELNNKTKIWNMAKQADFIIGMNGSELWDGENTYHYYMMKPEWIKETIDLMAPFDTIPFIYWHHAIKTKSLTKEIKHSCQSSQKEAILYKDIYELYEEENAKILFRVKEKDMKDIEAYIEKHPNPNYKGFKTQPTLMEFAHIKTSKGYALEQYCKMKNIDLKDVWAFGDTTNDNDMLKISGLGVCMINGSKDTKAIADVITDLDNNHDGLGDFLRKRLGS